MSFTKSTNRKITERLQDLLTERLKIVRLNMDKKKKGNL